MFKLFQSSDGGQHTYSGEGRVAVIVGYYNGASFIGEQLQSIIDQTHTDFHIFIFDDSSERAFSLDALCLDQESLSKISVYQRSCNFGFVKNFLDALAGIPDDFQYIAFSDQDDIWYENKLEKGIAVLEKITHDEPALYCARTEITDAECVCTLGYSPLFDKKPSFSNALVQSIAGGNTMVFNKAAKELILATVKNTTVVSHDWWCYQVVTGAGGYVIYDPDPCLKYRQHGQNLFGTNSSWGARFKRLRWFLGGRFKEWIDINLAALSAHKYLLSTNNQNKLDVFIEARQSSLIKRLVLFRRVGIYRQTFLGNLSLFIGCVLNKV